MKFYNFYVYIMASERNGTIYIGVTSDLSRRRLQHTFETKEGFTEKYNVHRLVYYEYFQDINNAIKREKQLKNWKREWKIALIEKKNSGWNDLFELQKFRDSFNES